MTAPELNVVTGAFSYTGKYIARRLLALGKEVRTLTGHPDREDPFDERVRAFPYDFERPAALAESLRGATTLYNTYWVRFPHGQASFDKAVDNTEVLIEAAREAGVGRIVHISVSNASPIKNWSCSSPPCSWKEIAIIVADLRRNSGWLEV